MDIRTSGYIPHVSYMRGFLLPERMLLSYHMWYVTPGYSIPGSVPSCRLCVCGGNSFPGGSYARAKDGNIFSPRVSSSVRKGQ